MARRLDSQPWMSTPGIARLLTALTAKGAEVRFVGGCVRDALAGRPVREIDLATDARPEEVIALLETAAIKAVPTGLAHGTITAVVDGQPFEITTLRVDVATDGRRATVAYGTDWEADAARRDLTINAMSVTPDGALFDPFGGESDLRAGRIRFVGDARTRIREDVLRLLRWFRFYAYLGRPPPDAEALAACRALAPGLAKLSRERVRHEVVRLLEAPEPLPSLQLMEETGVLAQVFGSPVPLDRIAGLRRAEESAGLSPDSTLRLAALVPKGAADRVAERLRLTTAEHDRIAAIAAAGPSLTPALDPRDRRAITYRLGQGAARDRLLLAWADDPDGQGWPVLLAELDSWRTPEFPLAGRDVRALGIPAGRRIGQLLKTVEDWWIGEDFEPDRAACLAHLRRLAGNDAAEA